MENHTRLPVSTIVLTLNEEENIADCLTSVMEWSGEIFVVDSGSTDNTVAIVKQMGIEVVTHPWDHYAAQRNWAQRELPLKYDWVFHLDADERVAPDLVKQLYQFFSDGRAQKLDGAMIKRRTFFMGKWIRRGGHYPSWHMRLFRRDKGHCEEQLYDQHFLVKGQIARLNGDLDNVLPRRLDVWLNRHIEWAEKEANNSINTTNLYPTVQANAMGTPIERQRWLKQNIFGRVPLLWRAFGYFLYRYILLGGFLDGTEGLIFHFLQGCWFRFYIDAKIYEKRHSS